MIFISFSLEKIIMSCSYSAPFFPPNLLDTHKPNLQFANSLATYTGSLHSMNQISCPFSMA